MKKWLVYCDEKDASKAPAVHAAIKHGVGKVDGSMRLHSGLILAQHRAGGHAKYFNYYKTKLAAGDLLRAVRLKTEDDFDAERKAAARKAAEAPTATS